MEKGGVRETNLEGRRMMRGTCGKRKKRGKGGSGGRLLEGEVDKVEGVKERL